MTARNHPRFDCFIGIGCDGGKLVRIAPLE